MATEHPRRWTLFAEGSEIVALGPKLDQSVDKQVEVVPTSDYDRVVQERDLALRAAGFESYEAARRHILVRLGR